VPFDAEDFARTALVRILPRSRYRLAAQTDSRFQAFASNTLRIAYRQQGATPAFLLFVGPGQSPHAAAMAAAAWAEVNWRPNAIQRRVKPGVIAVHIAPGNQLTPAGPVAGAVVPAAVWTVDSATGRVETSGNPPGSPSSSAIKGAAVAMMRGAAPSSLGELDMAEKGVMQMRTVHMPGALSGIAGILLLVLAVRYGLGGVMGLLVIPELLSGGVTSVGTGEYLLIVGRFFTSALMLAGIVLGAALIFNWRNTAIRVAWFSSPSSTTRNLAWGGYIAVMLGLAVVIDGVIPVAERQYQAQDKPPSYSRVTVTVNDDAGYTDLYVGGDLKVDLSAWPSTEWPGVEFKSSNPSVLELTSVPTSGEPPVAHFEGKQAGAARAEASSSDGRYTFTVSVGVGPAP
jgi:hypothetical protein